MGILIGCEYSRTDAEGMVYVGMGMLWGCEYLHTDVSGVVCVGMEMVWVVRYSRTDANGGQNGGRRNGSVRRLPFTTFV